MTEASIRPNSSPCGNAIQPYSVASSSIQSSTKASFKVARRLSQRAELRDSLKRDVLPVQRHLRRLVLGMMSLAPVALTMSSIETPGPRSRKHPSNCQQRGQPLDRGVASSLR